MKKLLILLLLPVILLTACKDDNGTDPEPVKTFTLDAESTEVTGSSSAFDIGFYNTLTNTGDTEITFRCRMEMVDLLDGHQATFCWGVGDNGTCYPPQSDDFTSDPGRDVTLQPGESISTPEFLCYLYPNGVIGESTVRYIVYEVENEENSQSVEITINAGL